MAFIHTQGITERGTIVATYLDVKTEADLLLLTDMVDGDKAKTSGKLNALDGLGADWVYDSSKSLINNGGTTLNGWVMKTDIIKAQYFGILGDGSDETTKIQGWLDALSEGKKLEGLKNTQCRISSTINIPNIDGSSIDFMGMELYANSGDITAPDYYVTNSYTNTNALAAVATTDMTKNELTIDVDDATPFSVGDMVIVNRATSIDGKYTDGDFIEIASISINTLTFKESFSVTIPASEVRFTIKPLVKDVKIKDLRVRVANDTDYAVLLKQLENSQIKGITLTNDTPSTIGLNMQDSSNCIISKCDVKDFRINQSFGYGIVVNGNKITVTGNKVSGCKHNLTSGASQYASRAIDYLYNHATDSISSSIDWHYNVINSVCKGNTITGERGVNVRSQGNCKVVGNFINTREVSILIYNDTNISAFNRVTEDVEVSGNHITAREGSVSTGAIRLVHVNDEIYNMDIHDNYFTDCQGKAMHFQTTGTSAPKLYNSSFKDNTLLRCEGLMQNPNMLSITDNKCKDLTGPYNLVIANDGIGNNIVKRNVFDGVVQSAIRFTNGNGLIFEDNIMKNGVTTDPIDIRLPASVKLKVSEFGDINLGVDIDPIMKKAKAGAILGNGQTIPLEIEAGTYQVDGTTNYSSVVFYSYGVVIITGTNTSTFNIKNITI